MTETTSGKLGVTLEREKASRFGVVVFIVDDDNRVLVIQDLTSKSTTARKEGEFSVVCETREEGEDWGLNFVRGLREELGIKNKVNLDSIFDYQKMAVWETGFVDGVFATVAKLRCSNPDKLLEVARGSKEVKVIGWKTREKFEGMKPRREGVVNIMNKFANDIFGK